MFALGHTSTDCVCEAILGMRLLVICVAESVHYGNPGHSPRDFSPTADDASTVGASLADFNRRG